MHEACVCVCARACVFVCVPMQFTVRNGVSLAAEVAQDMPVAQVCDTNTGCKNDGLWQGLTC